MLLDTLTIPPIDQVPTFYARYIGQLGGEPVRATLERQLRAYASYATLSEADAAALHPPYTWSAKQVIGHVSDAERVFSYRVLCLARGETKPLPGFDENDYAAAANHATLPIAAVVDEFVTARQSTLALLRNLPDAVAGNKGNAAGFDVTAGIIGVLIAAHAEHHRRILQQRLGK
jgi:hypothetical protein